jgi:hypothetical protein
LLAVEVLYVKECGMKFAVDFIEVMERLEAHKVVLPVE